MVAGIDYDVKVMEPMVYRPITAREVLMGSEVRQHGWNGRLSTEVASNFPTRRDASSSVAAQHDASIDAGSDMNTYDVENMFPSEEPYLEAKQELPEEQPRTWQEPDRVSLKTETERTPSTLGEGEDSVETSFPSTPSDESIVPPSIYSEATCDDFSMEECDLQALIGGGDDFHSTEDYVLMNLGDAGEGQDVHPWGWLQPDLSIQT